MNETIDNELNERLLKWAKGKKAPPFSIEAKITPRCNLKCPFCGSTYLTKEQIKTISKTELPKSKWLKIVEEAGKIGVRRFTFFGGEAMIRRELTLRLMKKIKKYDMEGTFLTNGTLFSSRDAKELVEMKWDVLKIAVDGAYEKTHDSLRGNGTFAKITYNIMNINRWKKKLKKNNPRIELFFLLCNKNYTELPQMIKLAHKLKCDNVGVTTVQMYTPAAKKFQLNIKETYQAQRYIEEATKLAIKLNISTNISHFLNRTLERDGGIKNSIIKFGDLPCFLPWYQMYIDPYGRVSVCGALSGYSNTESEKITIKSLEEVWDGVYFNKLRRGMLKGVFPPFCCSLCDETHKMSTNKFVQERFKKNINLSKMD